MASKQLCKELEAFNNEKKAYGSYICKAPPSLRSLNEDAYEPRVVGLGLYHHHQSGLLPQRKFKLEAVTRNLQRMSDMGSGMEQKLRTVHKAVEDRREEMMAYYHDDLVFDANNLILDACLVIEVCMVKAGKAEKMLERLSESSAFTSSVLCDILKLENQVPLFLLKLIISFQENIHCNDMVSILTWACERVFVLPEEKEDLIRQEAARMLESSSDSPAHLLECLQRLIIWNIGQDEGNQFNQDSSLRNLDNATTNPYESVSVMIEGESSQRESNSIISQGKQGISRHNTNVTRKIGGGKSRKRKRKLIMRSVARAQNLARVGIAFKAGTSLRFEERFCKMKGVLYLPALHTSTDTETLLQNVIAFEECYCIPENKVSRFVFLIGCLIDKEEDVALLRNEELIDNSMDSEQAVAEMFNGLTKHITTHYFTSTCDEIWEKLQKYYASSWRVMVKEFIDTHFSKPWLFCATVAAVLVLFLTIVQTYYTIKPPQLKCLVTEGMGHSLS